MKVVCTLAGEWGEVCPDGTVNPAQPRFVFRYVLSHCVMKDGKHDEMSSSQRP
jgi:hypothetical protein